MNEGALHPLLVRQLRRTGQWPPSEELAELLGSVSAAYADHDEDRALMNRAMDLASDELIEANVDLHVRLDELERTRQELVRKQREAEESQRLATLGQLAAGEGTFNLNGGTLNAPRIAQGAGAGTFHFDGGTLRATSATVTFMEGIDSVTVKNGGAAIDSDLAVTIAQDLLENGVSTGGGLTKQGSGTLTVSGASTYTGATSVNGGGLDTTTKPTGAGAYFVANGTTFTLRGRARPANSLLISELQRFLLNVSL